MGLFDEEQAEAQALDHLQQLGLSQYEAQTLLNLFQQHDSAADVEAMLGFRINKWNVFVRADGRIRICDGTQPTDLQPVFEPAQV